MNPQLLGRVVNVEEVSRHRSVCNSLVRFRQSLVQFEKTPVYLAMLIDVF